MTSCYDIFIYFKEFINNRLFIKNLFWFQKHRGIKWIKGQNFGDYLSCVVVSETARKLGLKKSNLPDKRNLFSIGSILHFAKNGDTVWGSGVNGKISAERHVFSTLDVRMVRGPKTREFLLKKGIPTANIYGDPALLLPKLFPKLKKNIAPGKVIILPNLNEYYLIKNKIPPHMKLISPFEHWRKVLNEILTSEMVLSSSLHGIILSEAFEISVRFVMPFGGETLFKYQDYYLGTGRSLNNQPPSFKDCIKYNCGVAMPPPVYNIEKMLLTFPRDIFA